MLTTLEIANGGVEIPPVDKSDLRRFWLRYKKLREKIDGDNQQLGTTAFSSHLVRHDLRSPAVDPLAVFSRSMILMHLEADPLMNAWMIDGELEDVVYQKAAHGAS